MLYLIGLGLTDEKDLSLRGYEILESSDQIYIDRYTHIIDDRAIHRLEDKLNKKIIMLGREEIESEKIILDNSKEHKVSLIVGGDPLVATTHISLLQSCIDNKIQYKVIHSSSIISSAIGESGLQTYKFGKSVTLTFWYDNYKPTSPYKVIKNNLEQGLHTLIFIDLNNQNAMDFSTIVKTFEQMELVEKANLLDDFNVLVLSRVGYPDQKLTYGKLTQLKDVGHTPYILIAPGKLHFIEEEWLANFKG